MLQGDSSGIVSAPTAAPHSPVNIIDAALATALERASAAGEWSTVAILAGELAARRTAAAAPPCAAVHEIESASVINLATERAKRER